MNKIQVLIVRPHIAVNQEDKANTSTQRMCIEDELENYYKLLDCDTIDIVTRKIGDKYYSIVCDDNALLGGCPVVSMMDPTNKDNIIFNSVAITGMADEEGRLTSLTEDDIENIMDNMVVIYGVIKDEKGIDRPYALSAIKIGL